MMLLGEVTNMAIEVLSKKQILNSETTLLTEEQVQLAALTQQVEELTAVIDALLTGGSTV